MPRPHQPLAPRREYPSAPLLGVGIVVADGARVLLIQRGNEPMRGLWTLPGGLVDTGEPVREAARREAREETGLEVEVGDLVEVVDSIQRDAAGRARFHFVILDFLARCPDAANARAASDANALAWIGWDDLAGYPTTPGLGPVLAKARRLLAGRG